MPMIPRRHSSFPIALGRPSQNLGLHFNAQINGVHSLPINIFPSNPLTLNRGLHQANAIASKSAQFTSLTPAASRLMMPVPDVISRIKVRLPHPPPKHPRFVSEIGTAISVDTRPQTQKRGGFFLK